MKNYKVLVVALVVLVALIVVGTITRQAPEEAEALTLGVITGLTGEYAFVGENYRNGITLAHEQYQESHPEQPLHIILEDDGFEAKKGLSAYKKLTGIDKIDALINMTSPTINVIYDQVTKVDMPVLQGGEQSQDPSPDNVFQILPGHTSKDLGAYTKEQYLEGVALIYSNNATFLRFADSFMEGYAGNLTEYKLDAVTNDYRTLASKIHSGDHSTLVFLTLPEEGALTIKELFGLSDTQPPIIFDASFQTGIEDYKRILGDLTILDGNEVMRVIERTSDDFVQAYSDRFGEEPGIGATWAYDSFNILMESYNPDGKTWIRNIENIEHDGASGNVVFDENGVNKPDFEIATIENGAI